MNWVELQSPFDGLKLWGSHTGDYQFVISHEMDGYRASWKNSKMDLTPYKQPANYVDGSPFKRFIDAEEACKAVSKQLGAKQ